MVQEYMSRSGKTVVVVVLNGFWKINWFVAMLVIKENISSERPRNGKQANNHDLHINTFWL